MGGTEITRDEAEARGVDITARYSLAAQAMAVAMRSLHTCVSPFPRFCPNPTAGPNNLYRVNVNFVYIFSTVRSDLPPPKAEVIKRTERRHSEMSMPAAAETNPLVDPLLKGSDATEEGPRFLTGPNPIKRSASVGF